MDELAKAGQKEQLLLLAWMVTHQWEIGPVRVPRAAGCSPFPATQESLCSCWTLPPSSLVLFLLWVGPVLFQSQIVLWDLRTTSHLRIIHRWLRSQSYLVQQFVVWPLPGHLQWWGQQSKLNSSLSTWMPFAFQKTAFLCCLLWTRTAFFSCHGGRQPLK